jgi:hypothetical protein
VAFSILYSRKVQLRPQHSSYGRPWTLAGGVKASVVHYCALLHCGGQPFAGRSWMACTQICAGSELQPNPLLSWQVNVGKR